MAIRRVNPFKYFRDQRGNITKLGLMSFVSGYFQAATLVLIVPLVTAISKGEKHYKKKLGPVHIDATVGQLIIVALITIVVAAVFDIWIAWVRSHVVTRWELQRREEVIREYLNSDYSIQAGERLGTLSTLIGYANRGAAALGNLTNGLEAVITIAMFIVFAIVVDFRAALFLILVVGTLTVVLQPVMRRTKRYAQATAAMAVEYNREVTEVTRMVRDVRVFHATEPLADHLTFISRKLQRLKQRTAFASGITSPVYQYTGVFLLVAALAVAKNVHSLDLAVVGGIALLVLRSLSFGQQLQNAYQGYLDCFPYVEELEQRRRQYVESARVDGTVTLGEAQRLDLEDIHFSYDGDVEALAGVSGSFSVGEIVGIVGPSGGGKSTLSQLILRLREPTGGALLVNGVNAADYTLASWYRNVSLVPQDPRLLHASVADNIAFLDASITREQIVAAARAAGVHEVIEELEQGYETLIGPAFRDLSGGQIQRVGIARALARGARILVLDEPTSALDVHSEVIIQNTLESLRSHALVMIIAHRLSTLSICDRIVVLHHGQLETMGTLAYVSEQSDFFKRALDAGTLEIGHVVPPPAATVPLEET